MIQLQLKITFYGRMELLEVEIIIVPE